MSNQVISGVDWTQVNERLKHHWGLLTDHDLEQAEGNIRKLVGIVQEKTGRDKDEVERFVYTTVDEATSTMQQMASKLADSFQGAGDAVRQRPLGSVSTAFGAGIIAGMAIGCVLVRSR